MNNIIKYGGLGLGAFFIANLMMSGPRCQFANIKRSSDVFWGDGLDYGIIISASVRNVGTSGSVNIEGVIGTGEGNFKSSRTMTLEKGQLRRVEFKFTQPSIAITPQSIDVSFKCV